ncbi:MAG TPA: glycosyltransferase [Hanamia sp.]|jgi:glycosyltransferase involved in cell wall biosynthesis|nr:glycosyltransferase [Hanamia sp.]
MNALPKATVIISVYNRMDFLRLVLAGFETQTEKNFEIIISDDGSGPEFRESLRQLIATTSLNIKHNWHPDIGFRKNLALNNSIKMSAAPYLIFIDGDCIPHPCFVEEHLKNAEQKVCLIGRRVMLSKRITSKLTAKAVSKGIMNSGKMQLEMLGDYLTLHLFHFKKGLYVRNKWLRKFLNRKKNRGLLGCNFSLYKSDLLSVNGFDERYQAATYGEDVDLEMRLKLIGTGFKTLMNIAVQYHCYHQLLERPEESRLLYELATKEQRAFTPYGIEKKPGN